MPILDTSAPPTYQQIAGKAAHLRELGLSDVVIACRLGVSDKTVAKAIGWIVGVDCLRAGRQFPDSTIREVGRAPSTARDRV